MQSGGSSKSNDCMLKHYGITDKHVNVKSNDIRKAGVNLMEQLYPGDMKKQKLLSTSTFHSMKTAEKHYERYRDIDDCSIQNIRGHA